MENNYQNRSQYDDQRNNVNFTGTQNRCRRCHRPLGNPMQAYGWRCAQILGLEQPVALTADFFNDSGDFSVADNKGSLDKAMKQWYDNYLRTGYESVGEEFSYASYENSQKFNEESDFKDKEILTKNDFQKVNMLKGIYDWAIIQGDHFTADIAHYIAVQIRQQPKYSDLGYGPLLADTQESIGTESAIWGTKGYDDNYNYSTDINRHLVSITFSDAYSADDIGWDSGTGVSWIAEAWPGIGNKYVDFFMTFLADPIAKTNPLYGKMEVGDRKATVIRKNEKTTLVEWKKEFYFHMRDDSAELYLVK